MVDDHNNLSHALSSIQDKWVTDQRERWVFAFFLAKSEINVRFILRYFVYCGLRWEGMPTLMEFSRKLAWKPINNIYIGEREGGG